MPSGDLAFSVMLFLITAVFCFMILIIRRKAFGGELGGPYKSKVFSAILMVILWVVYLLFSILQVYGFIKGF